MTPQERQCINELLEAATINGVSIEAAVRSIGREMPHLSAAEVAETCRAHAEELSIAQTIKRPDFDSEPAPWRA
jgi:hypothetical protein